METGSSRSPWSEERARELIEAHLSERGPLLVILHALQDEFGCIDERAIPLVASALNISRAEVYGVVTFYKDFRSEPRGTTSVQICRAEACQSMGANALATHAQDCLGAAFGETTEDGSVTLEQVFCLGNCALSPAITIDGHLYGRVDAARFDALFAARAESAR